MCRQDRFTKIAFYVLKKNGPAEQKTGPLYLSGPVSHHASGLLDVAPGIVDFAPGIVDFAPEF